MNRYRSCILAAAAVLATPALAQSDFGPPPVAQPEARYDVAPTTAPVPDAIHSGANNPADTALADSVAAALAADPRMEGATITVAANDGRVSLTGSARTPEQAGHAVTIARGVAGVSAVSGTLSSQGG